MKSISFYSLALVCLLFASCSKDDSKDKTNLDSTNITTSSTTSIDFDLERQIRVTKTTKYISKSMLKSGIIKLNFEQKGKRKSFKPVTVKNFELNENVRNFSDYNLIFENNFVFLKRNPNFQLSTIKDRIYIRSDKYTGFMDDSKEELLQKHGVLLMLLNEVITSSDQKIQVRQPEDPENPDPEYAPSSGLPEDCSFMGTITRSYYGNTRSTAEAEASYQRAMAQELYNTSLTPGAGSACKPFGGIDSSCLFGNHGCVASYSVCCD